MASAKKCDVCKTLFEEFSIPDVTINIYHHPYGEYRVDLCPKCQKKLELFVSGFEEALELKVNNKVGR